MNRRTFAFVMFFLLSTLACRAPDPNAALHRATALGTMTKVKELVEQGADVNKMVDGETPLMAAARHQNAEAMTYLIEKGADLTVKDPKGRDLWQLLRPNAERPMHGPEAICLAMLIEHGFHDRMTLMEAAKYSNSAVLIKRLVDDGADLHTVDEYGWTPLHWAAYNAFSDTCAGLLNAGIEVNAESTAEYSLFVEGGEDGHPRVLYLYEKGSRPLDVARRYSYKGQKSCSQVLKDFGGTHNPKVKNVHKG